MKALRQLANRHDPRSLSAWFRRRRSAHFREFMARVPGRVRILDVGGEDAFWDAIGHEDRFDITMLNIDAKPTRFRFVLGDACDLSPFADGEFDVVVSNSVIEHVDDPAAMAREIRRVGKRWYVQTPNRAFPLEPHFLFPFFPYLPRRVRVWLVTHFDVGWLAKTGDRRRAEEIVDSVRLLNARELSALFPDGALYREKFLGLTKSLIAYSVGR